MRIVTSDYRFKTDAGDVGVCVCVCPAARDRRLLSVSPGPRSRNGSYVGSFDERISPGRSASPYQSASDSGSHHSDNSGSDDEREKNTSEEKLGMSSSRCFLPLICSVVIRMSLTNSLYHIEYIKISHFLSKSK